MELGKAETGTVAEGGRDPRRTEMGGVTGFNWTEVDTGRKGSKLALRFHTGWEMGRKNQVPEGPC